MPSARNDIEPEYTLSAFAQTAPSAIASSVTSASRRRWLTKPAVGLPEYLPALGDRGRGRAATSSTTQETNTPRPAHRPVARGWCP